VPIAEKGRHGGRPTLPPLGREGQQRKPRRDCRDCKQREHRPVPKARFSCPRIKSSMRRTKWTNPLGQCYGFREPVKHRVARTEAMRAAPVRTRGRTRSGAAARLGRLDATDSPAVTARIHVAAAWPAEERVGGEGQSAKVRCFRCGRNVGGNDWNQLMRSRSRMVLASVLGILALGSFLLWITAPGPGINRRSYGRIQLGMRESEVTRLLQALPGDYITGKPRVKIFGLTSEFPWLISIDAFREHRATERQFVDPRVKEWYGKDGIILVRFDRDGTVDLKSFFEVAYEDESVFVKIRRWLGI
jgi:hypothetical protein